MDFIGRCTREVVDDFDMPGHFVVGDLSAAEIDDLARFDPLALFRHNKRETNFAEPLVGCAADHGLSDFRMSFEITLDLRWIGIAAADNEHFLGASGNLQQLSAS